MMLGGGVWLEEAGYWGVTWKVCLCPCLHFLSLLSDHYDMNTFLYPGLSTMIFLCLSLPNMD